MSTTTTASDSERAARVALSQLDGVGPARLAWLMGERSAQETLGGLCSGTLPTDDDAAPRGVSERSMLAWQAAARRLDPPGILANHRAAGIEVLIPGDHQWPFDHDPEPPSVLYVWGDATRLRARPAVAIVGTRRCTDLGRTIASDLGADLAAAGIDVISGLALGIDGAAHAGTLGVGVSKQLGSARGVPLAVVANGLDRVSPRFHRALTERVASQGAVVSEAPLGINGDRWRFPARNRLIAGLSDVVIVVESHAKGGALITVDEAIERGIPVMAVPGSIRSAASVGTNRLLAEGAVPLCSVDDVLALLDLSAPTSMEQGRLFDASAADDGLAESGGPGSAVPDPTDLAQVLLSELATGSASIDSLVRASNASLADVMVAVQRLAVFGRVTQVGSTVSLAIEAGRSPR